MGIESTKHAVLMNLLKVCNYKLLPLMRNLQHHQTTMLELNFGTLAHLAVLLVVRGMSTVYKESKCTRSNPQFGETPSPLGPNILNPEYPSPKIPSPKRPSKLPHPWTEALLSCPPHALAERLRHQMPSSQ